MHYTAEDLIKWYPCKCPACGWIGLSRDCKGGGEVAGTGDYADVLCPVCYKREEYIPVDDATVQELADAGGV